MAAINITEKTVDILVNGGLHEEFTQRDNSSSYDVIVSASSSVDNPTHSTSSNVSVNQNETETTYTDDFSVPSGITYSVDFTIDGNPPAGFTLYDDYNSNGDADGNEIGSIPSDGTTVTFSGLDGRLAIEYSNGSNVTGSGTINMDWTMTGISATGSISVDDVTQQ